MFEVWYKDDKKEHPPAIISANNEEIFDWAAENISSLEFRGTCLSIREAMNLIIEDDEETPITFGVGTVRTGVKYLNSIVRE